MKESKEGEVRIERKKTKPWIRELNHVISAKEYKEIWS
jgi:hypothetical protein